MPLFENVSVRMILVQLVIEESHYEAAETAIRRKHQRTAAERKPLAASAPAAREARNLGGNPNAARKY